MTNTLPPDDDTMALVEARCERNADILPFRLRGERLIKYRQRIFHTTQRNAETIRLILGDGVHKLDASKRSYLVYLVCNLLDAKTPHVEIEEKVDQYLAVTALVGMTHSPGK